MMENFQLVLIVAAIAVQNYKRKTLSRSGAVDDFLVMANFQLVLLAAAIAVRVYKRKSLSGSGAVDDFLVMAIHIAAGYRFGVMLFVFFFTLSKLTRLGENKKRSMSDYFKDGGRRNRIHVQANSKITTFLAVAMATLTGGLLNWEEGSRMYLGGGNFADALLLLADADYTAPGAYL